MVAPYVADLAVIIVNWNTRELLRRCLGSLAAEDDQLRVQIIVVDNGSTDGSQTMIRERFPDVVLVQNTTNVGFAPANNQGARLANAPLLLFLNSDAAVMPGALSIAVAFMQGHPDVGIVGLHLLNDDLTHQYSDARFPTLFSTLVSLLPVSERWRTNYELRRNWHDDTQVTYVDSVSGAALLIRRDLFVDLHGFDESYYFYSEEFDLCWRVKKRGLAVVYLPSARVIHSGGGASGRVASVRLGLLVQRGRFILLQRHKPAPQVAILHGYLLAFTALRVVLAVIRMRRGGGTVTLHENAHLYAREFLWLLKH